MRANINMIKPNTCQGCFADWNFPGSICPHCGWDCQKKYPPLPFWNISETPDSRYVIGKLYCHFEDMVIWRIYDRLLGIPCFALMKEGHREEELAGVARRLQSVNKLYKGYVAVLGIKEIDARKVLLFSILDRYADANTFKQLLQAEMEYTDEIVVHVSGQTEREFMLPRGTLLADRYQNIGCIGIGGFGLVYLCEDIYLHRNVAIKEYFPPEWAERDGSNVKMKKNAPPARYRLGKQAFIEEAGVSSGFIHVPSVITMFDVFEENDTAYLVMEYVPGVSIGREMRARKYKPYSPDDMSDIILPVLAGLKKIHEKGIVHGDISPGNIMRSKWGDIKLIDFGAARCGDSLQQAASATFIKVSYAAPEQYQTAKEGIPKEEGPWTDLYSAGATMAYLLTGQKPRDVVSRRNAGTEDILSGQDMHRLGPWRKVIERATAFNKAERFQTAVEFGRAIQEIQNDLHRNL